MLNSYSCPTISPNSLQLHPLWKRLWNTGKSIIELKDNDDDEDEATARVWDLSSLSLLPILSSPHPTTMLPRRWRRTKIPSANLPLCKEEEEEEEEEEGDNLLDQNDQHQDNDMLMIPPFSPTYCQPNHFPYSNFYVKLPDGRWMVRFRDGNRSILGTDVIDGDLI